MASLPQFNGDFAIRTCPPVRAIVFAGTGGREVIRLEERPDPLLGSEEVLVAATFSDSRWLAWSWQSAHR